MRLILSEAADLNRIFKAGWAKRKLRLHSFLTSTIASDPFSSEKEKSCSIHHQILQSLTTSVAQAISLLRKLNCWAQ
jgi:hypothetical protein